MMTINTINTLLTLTTDETIVAELTAELEKAKKTAAKKAEEVAAKAAVYAEAHDVVMGVLADATAPLTLADLYTACGADLSISKSQLAYALRVYWADEVEKTEGKVNAYAHKA